VFPQRKAESQGCREASVELRLPQRGTTASESEGIALPAGRWASLKTGGGQVNKPEPNKKAPRICRGFSSRFAQSTSSVTKPDLKRLRKKDDKKKEITQM
jgi:hypothetical protein